MNVIKQHNDQIKLRCNQALEYMPKLTQQQAMKAMRKLQDMAPGKGIDIDEQRDLHGNWPNGEPTKEEVCKVIKSILDAVKNVRETTGVVGNTSTFTS